MPHKSAMEGLGYTTLPPLLQVGDRGVGDAADFKGEKEQEYAAKLKAREVAEEAGSRPKE